MPEPDPLQPELFPEPVAPSDDELLDEFCLNTVLEMLTVIYSVEELALLETLTNAQKRQVWDATPEAVKVRVKQIRASASKELPAANQTESSASEELNKELNEELDEELNESETRLDALVEDESLPDEELGEELAIASSDSSTPVTHEPMPSVEDWIVLKAKPKLTAAELIAIWEVVEIQNDYARISAKGLGTRLYPVNWMLIYPKSPEAQQPIETDQPDINEMDEFDDF
jgi:hypothetical protein